MGKLEVVEQHQDATHGWVGNEDINLALNERELRRSTTFDCTPVLLVSILTLFLSMKLLVRVLMYFWLAVRHGHRGR